MQVPGDPREHYIARMSWIDAETIAIQQLNRLQNRHDLLQADVRSGATRLVLRDESSTWVDVDGDKARKGDRWDMGARIREVEQGPRGAVYLLEDEREGAGGRLLRLEPAGPPRPTASAPRR